MKAFHLTKILLLFALLTFHPLAFAATPQNISYQGYLKNTDGTPVSTLVSVTFRLYTQSSGGAPIWADTMNVTPVNGIYSVILGGVTTLDSTVFDSNALYLGVQVASEAELSPRQQITNTPYAFRADIADSISSTASLNTGNPIVSSVADGTPPLQVDSATLVTNLNADMLDGKHAAEFVDTSSSQTIAGAKSFSNIIGGSISGNAATVTNGIYNGGNSGGIFIGTNDNAPISIIANDSQVILIEPDVNSPNIVAGYTGNTRSAGVRGVKIGGGGAANNVNRVTDSFGTVSGGVNNQAGDNAGTTSDKSYATVAGGLNNTASGYASFVGGGDGNTASGAASFAGGGYTNSASGAFSVVPGGRYNTALGQDSLAAGMWSQAIHDSTFVWSDGTSLTSTAPGQFLIGASNGVGINKNNPATALDVNGTVTATAFSGSGAGLTNVNAATVGGLVAASFAANAHTHSGIDINSGTIDDILLSSNVAKLNVNQTFTQTQTFNDYNLLLRNFATTYTTALRAPASTANRTINFPDSNGIIITTGNLSDITATGIISSGTWNGTAISTAKGGTGIDTSNVVSGGLLKTTGTGTWGVLPAGSDGSVLKISGGQPSWGSAGTVTSVATGTGLSGGPITSSGTLSIDTAVVPRLSAQNTFSTGNQTIQTGAAATKGLLVKGAASQTANLQEWQNSAGAAVASVSATGNISSSGDITTTGGNLYLPSTSSSGTSGGIYFSGTRIIHTYGNNFFAGASAGNLTTTGGSNTSVGNASLYSNSAGTSNSAFGAGALNLNTDGSQNVAVGRSALGNNTVGSNNTVIGYSAGNNLSTGGNYNIYVGNSIFGDSNESNTVRIGNANQNRAFIAGIRGITTSGAAIPVLVDANGQLGTVSSSRRFKEEIADMGDATDGLMRLRPVSFYYKQEYSKGPRLLQYGLIAEEVAQVFPDLVQYDNKGEIETVSYHFVNAMLLNEVQKQHRRLDQQQATIDQLKAELAEIRKLLRR